MKTETIVGVSILGVIAYLVWKNAPESGSILDVLSDGLGLSSESGADPMSNNPSATDEYVKKTQRLESTSTDTASAQDFKTSLYQSDYTARTSGGISKKSVKYIQNDTMSFTVVKEEGKTVGGFDFKTSQSINSTKATLLEKNKSNPIVGILRGLK